MAKIAPDRRKGTRTSLRRIANSLGLPMDRPVNDGLIDHRQIVPTADTGYYIVKVPVKG